MSLRIGVIGLGELGQLQAEILATLSDVEIVAGVDVDSDVRQSFEERFDVPTFETHDAMLSEGVIDCVVIVTPHTLHYEQAKAALEADAHVHIEKPLVTETARARELVRLADSRDRALQVGYQRHFHPGYREIKRLVDAGRIGEPHMASCYLGQDWVSAFGGTWRTDPALSGGGELIDSGSHLLDVLLWTTDTEPMRVAAITDTHDQDVDVNSAVSATLRGATRQVVASIGVTGDGHSGDERLTVWGTGGRLSYGGNELIVEEADGVNYRAEIDNPGYRELNRRKLSGFVEAVREGNEPPVPATFGLRVTQLTEAAFKAAETGRTVDATDL